MAFVNDIAGFDLFDHLGIVIVYRASALVSAFNGRVQASLFDVPLGNLKMLINVHSNLLTWVKYYEC